MFDNKTTMDVTVQVFGLSTLVSSYQIYNVDKRIQEDNLQHLACFSEYGRMALDGTGEEEGEGSKVSSAAAAVNQDEDEAQDEDEEGGEQEAKPKKKELQRSDSKKNLKEKPFQRLEFLVRDWQNFDEDMEHGQTTAEQSEIYARLKKEMDIYFADVVNARKSTDLKVQGRNFVLSSISYSCSDVFWGCIIGHSGTDIPLLRESQLLSTSPPRTLRH